MKFLFVFLTLFSCTQTLTQLDNEEIIVAPEGAQDINLVFSHNLNGETHPCGCRHFPLGGLAQVAGLLHQNQPAFYLDTGDALFKGIKIPSGLKKSSRFTARKIVEAFNQLGLDLFLPGDQDFAEGLPFFKQVIEKAKFPILFSNLRKDLFPHQKRIQKKVGNQLFTFYAVGLPELYPPEVSRHLVDPLTALEEIKKIRPHPFHHVVVLSHSGLDYDQKMAQAYSRIDWIIGSHTQSFLRKPRTYGKTKIVQALSRNHYLGMITFPANKTKKNQYELLEVRDEAKELLAPNPYEEWLVTYKQELEKQQLAEQALLNPHWAKEPFPTTSSCLDCHQPQGQFWKGTAHALAYATLKRVNQASDLQCLRCHGLGQGQLKGYLRATDLTRPKLGDKYWKKVQNLFVKGMVIRDLSSAKREKLTDQWLSLDEDFGVTHNYANVQCLNCHDKDASHPFSGQSSPHSAQKKFELMQDRCITCHTADQSPEWYQKGVNPPALSSKAYQAKLKKVACPLGTPL